MKQTKTNAMRILEKEKIAYTMLTYSTDDGKIDGVSVAHKIGREESIVYKTLVAQGTSKGYYVFVIPVEAELDLKKAAKAVSEKKIEMIPVKDITAVTGYIRGGCSPIGMKKLFPTRVDETARSLDTIIVSGGSIGVQIETTPANLIQATKAQFADIAKFE
ncbi:Cys-tRNA(Pro)/Cys-tRNA(Cys) deacylase [Brevibacillus reuszeri]|uniref:Cys-tRNA(Pro)/Cys-tRNA(Cys) deacylase n=1 Tax=Brevibacillus reuszeri TaxID=54915 RepID=A0A0K9YNK7_9BACL|nr:Cys-tRNA(Pro) deacylase [Brevibacillus reuszeri]KNB69750.1 cysteinyl-tRNA(Pro) deacylase [Brevibacillus reuszeri]MED1858092.1 Cys-tRNA(Pro) deacylase [Brevibacillus reuszeri]GED68916.1 Cys-tRNA(Pro)/Cys-tRNA(Cys) deacylase [Brevibacillus reuszeri]